MYVKSAFLQLLNYQINFKKYSQKLVRKYIRIFVVLKKELHIGMYRKLILRSVLNIVL